MQSLHFELREEGLKAAIEEIAKKREKRKDSKFSILYSVDVTVDGEEAQISNRRVEIVEYTSHASLDPECENFHPGESCELEASTNDA